jgi:hypothetical protein
MSYNDPGFLFNNRRTENEREAERQEWQHHKAVAERHYKCATWLVILTMLYVALPTGWESLHWQVVICVGVLILILAVLMLLQGAKEKALVSLLFATLILPGWIKAAPSVVKVLREQAAVIEKEWRRIL